MNRSITSMIIAAASLCAGSAHSLTPGMVDSAVAYMEWMLEVRFSPPNRARFEQGLAETWRNETWRNNDAAEGLLAMIAAQNKLSAMPEADRKAVHAKVQGPFLEVLRSNPRDETARWLLALHASARQPGGDGPGALAGRWSSGRISTIQYRNSYTGAPAPTSGNRFAYEFKPDGTYSYTGLMQNTVYQCTTSVFSSETGTYRVQGDTVQLTPQSNPYKMTNNCAPSSNREAPGKLVNRSYRFRITSDQGHVSLNLTHPDGSVSSFRRDQ